MRSSHSLDRLDTAFDDDRLVADAGLLLPATLAAHLGLREIVETTSTSGRRPVGRTSGTSCSRSSCRRSPVATASTMRCATRRHTTGWEVGAHRRPVAAGRWSWGQPEPGDAGAGRSSPDNDETAQDCQMGRVRQARRWVGYRASLTRDVGARSRARRVGGLLLRRPALQPGQGLRHRRPRRAPRGPRRRWRGIDVHLVVLSRGSRPSRPRVHYVFGSMPLKLQAASRAGATGGSSWPMPLGSGGRREQTRSSRGKLWRAAHTLVAGTTPRRPTRAVAPRPTYGAEGTCHGHCLAHPGPGTPRGGNDTPKAREIGYSAASPRSCVWWRHCGRHRGRSDRRDRRWSARGDRRRHRRCCPWRYCRREDCRGCAAWRPAPGEAVHLRRRIAGAPKPTRLTPTRDPGTGHLPSGWRCTAATGSCRTFGGARPPVASATAPGSAPALRS